MPIPTDLASFLDLVRQHGVAVYSIVFAYAASHSLLISLFAGLAAFSVMSFGFGSGAGLVLAYCDVSPSLNVP